MIKFAARAIAVALLFSVTGCASIVSKSTWPVTIQSNPTGAKCVVSKKNGVQLQTGETPMTLTLNSSDGFFSSASYLISCQHKDKEGVSQAGTAPMDAHLNGWYWGNIVFGGLVGLLIVDPATGSMWKMDDTVVVQMAKQEKTAALAQ